MDNQKSSEGKGVDANKQGNGSSMGKDSQSSIGKDDKSSSSLGKASRSGSSQATVLSRCAGSRGRLPIAPSG